MADTYEIVLNWSDGNNVQIECVSAAVLVRPTRVIEIPVLEALADMSTHYSESDRKKSSR